MRGSSMFRKLAVSLAAAALLASPALVSPAGAFERTDEGNYIVFGGRQAIPVLDPHIRYDWSTRMIQQGVYDALLKY
jgi:peptide/nickel transport system substrate-binding protein